MNKKGFVSIYIILWLAVLIPFLLFVFVDLMQYSNQNVKLRSVTNNAAASAVSRLNEDRLPEGILEIDEDKAVETIEEILRKDLLLDENFEPLEGSTLREAPEIEIYIANEEDGSTEISVPTDTFFIDNTAVVIYAKYNVRGLFFHRSGVERQYLAISDAFFERVEE